MNGLADVRIEDWNRLQHEVARLRVLVILALLAVVAHWFDLFQPLRPGRRQAGAEYSKKLAAALACQKDIWPRPVKWHCQA